DRKSVWAPLPQPSDATEPLRFAEMSIPVKRLAQHALEHNFLSPLHHEINTLLEALSEAAFNINDQLSLTSFNLENSNANDTDATILQNIVSAIEEIKPEESAIREKKHELSVKVRVLLEEL